MSESVSKSPLSLLERLVTLKMTLVLQKMQKTLSSTQGRTGGWCYCKFASKGFLNFCLVCLARCLEDLSSLPGQVRHLRCLEDLHVSHLWLHGLSNCRGAWWFINNTCSHSVLHHTKYNLFIETLIETHREKGSLLESLFLWLFYCLLNIDICILLKTLTNDKPNGINVQRRKLSPIKYYLKLYRGL